VKKQIRAADIPGAGIWRGGMLYEIKDASCRIVSYGYSRSHAFDLYGFCGDQRLSDGDHTKKLRLVGTDRSVFWQFHADVQPPYAAAPERYPPADGEHAGSV